MSAVTEAAPAPAPSATDSAALELPAQPVAAHDKLSGHDFWDSIGRPKYVVAPMVDQSELVSNLKPSTTSIISPPASDKSRSPPSQAWRILSRLYGATLAYTPMFHAQLFSSPVHPAYQQGMFDMHPDSIEGLAPYDRPLVVQFCANDKDAWLAAAAKVVDRCDAVDLNIGCPQGIARKGNYGAFLMDDWGLIKDLISHVHANLAIPVIAKIRVYPTLEQTLEYATHVFAAGAQLLTVHGRVREAKGRLAGLADWSKIAQVVRKISPKVPVIANGGLPSAEELAPCLEETGAYALMSAEGNLYNPMIFNPENAAAGRAYRRLLPADMQAALDACDARLDFQGDWPDAAAYAPSAFLASQYLAVVRTIPHTPTGSSAIKAHLFKLFRPVWAAGRHLELREMLGRAGGGKLSMVERAEQYQAFVDRMEEGIRKDVEEGVLPKGALRPLTHKEVVEQFGGVVPYSHAQPYMRVPEADAAAVAPEAADATKRAHDAAASPTPASPSAPSAPKRQRIDEATGAPVDVVAACAHPGCANGGSARCPKGACKAHCAGLASGAGELVLCEFHADKAKREAEKREEMARRRREKGAKGKGGKKGKAGGGGEGVVVESEGVAVEVGTGVEEVPSYPAK